SHSLGLARIPRSVSASLTDLFFFSATPAPGQHRQVKAEHVWGEEPDLQRHQDAEVEEYAHEKGRHTGPAPDHEQRERAFPRYHDIATDLKHREGHRQLRQGEAAELDAGQDTVEAGALLPTGTR